MSNVAEVHNLHSGRAFRVNRLMANTTWDSNDERDAMIFALYRFTDAEFNQVWKWFVDERTKT